jgi:hypothetical protein
VAGLRRPEHAILMAAMRAMAPKGKGRCPG